jgi:hypothetical protein
LLLIVSGSNEITLDEIGKLTTIFKMKRGIMPILLWVLVKTKLGDAIAVTIIATDLILNNKMEL